MSFFRRLIPTKKGPDTKKKAVKPAGVVVPAVKKDSAPVEKEEVKKVAVKTEKKTPESKQSTTAGKAETKTKKTSALPGILLRPLITEKGTRLEGQGTYQFAVRQNANKVEIARAVAARYGINPVKVRVMHRVGKKVRFGRLKGKRADWKRALVTLPKGKTIDVHEGV